MKLHIVRLSPEEEKKLQSMVTTGTHPALEFQRAQILLKAHRQLKDTVIAEHLDCTPQHVGRIRKRYCLHGFQRALHDGEREGRPTTFKDKEKARIVALACTGAPEGYGRWTLDLLVEEAKKQEGIGMGRTKVWTILRENELKPWREKNVVHS
jgi:transposase